MPNNNKRPVFLDLTRIHQPVNAVLSIFHRLTGIMLVLLIPVLVFLFDRSLAGDEGFDQVVGALGSPGARIALVALAWIFAHHFFAGIRYLLIDVDIGVEIHRAKKSAWLVFVAGIMAMLSAAAVLL